MKNKRALLFNPGPTNVSEAVRDAVRTTDVCHREKEFSDVLARVRENILKVVNGQGSHTAVAFVSSATGCNEAVLASIEGKLLLLNNGKYSQRLKEIADRYNIPSRELVFDPLKPIDLTMVEEALKSDPEITHIVIVHHETTTGMLSPLRSIGELAKRYNKLLFADTVSSFGGHRIDLKQDHLSFCTVSANKCLESFPGISFVIAEKEALSKTKGKARSFYFDLYRQWEYEEQKIQTPFTPAVQLFFALDRALDELLEEGGENRIKRYERNAALMRAGLKDLGFRFLLGPETSQSNIVTAIKLPFNMDYWQVHDALKERGYTIYSGPETIGQGVFRIATLGRINEEDVNQFLSALGEVLEDLKMKPVYD